MASATLDSTNRRRLTVRTHYTTSLSIFHTGTVSKSSRWRRRMRLLVWWDRCSARAIFLTDIANDPAGIPRSKNIVRNVPGDHAACAYYAARSDMYTGKNKCCPANPHIGADLNRFSVLLLAAEFSS